MNIRSMKLMHIGVVSFLFFFLNGCGGVDPEVQLQKQKTMKQFYKLVKTDQNYLCIGKANLGKVSLIFNFRNYPDSIRVKCKKISSNGYCNYDLYRKFTGKTPINIVGNEITPKEELEGVIEINSIHSNHVDIKLIGVNTEANLNLICLNPLNEVTKVDKITSFKESPYSDSVLLKKLDQLLVYRPNPAKYSQVKKLIEYGIYISKKDLYKALGYGYGPEHYPYYTDYRVYKLLQINSGINESEIFSTLDNDDLYRLVNHGISFTYYYHTEYERMNGYAFVNYLTKFDVFNHAFLRYLRSEQKHLPVDVEKKLYDYIWTHNDEKVTVNLLIDNLLEDKKHIVGPYLVKILNKCNSDYTKQLNKFLIKILDLFVIKKDSGYEISNVYGFKIKPEYYDVLKALLKKSKPNKLTLAIYNYIVNKDSKTTQEIIAILNTKNIKSKARIQEYNKLLHDMIYSKDNRGALFYLKKGAIGNTNLITKALKNNMIDVAKIMSLQNIQLDQKIILDYALSYKRYDFVKFLLKNKKISKDILPEYMYQLLKENSTFSLDLADQMVDYGVDTSKVFVIAQKNNDDNVIKTIIKRYPNQKNKKLFVAYQKEQARIAKAKEEARKRAEIRKRKQEEALRKAYMARKYVGEKVCKDGRVALFLNITMSAYVESVRGDSIQLRIVDTEGTTPNYKGVSLYPNKIIWDKYYEWRKCR